jgi:hypothetical protein
MIAFIGKTWPLWWMFAVVFIVRCLHVLSVDPEWDVPEWDVLDSLEDDRVESHAVPGRIAS